MKSQLSDFTRHFYNKGTTRENKTIETSTSIKNMCPSGLVVKSLALVPKVEGSRLLSDSSFYVQKWEKKS